MTVYLRNRDRFGVSADLSRSLRALAQSLAANKITSSIWTDFTDNSGGVAGSLYPSMLVPREVFDGTDNVVAVSASVQTRQSSTGSYAIGEVIHPDQDTGTEPLFTVSHLELSSAAVAASGTGANATGVTFTGTTGTGTKFTVTGDIATNTLSNIAVVTRGDYTTNLTDITQEPITAVGYTGYKLSVLMGVKTAVLDPTHVGSLSAIHANPITTASTGAGTGATLNVVWNAPVAKSVYDAAAVTANNAMAVISDRINDVFDVLGIPEITYTGTVSVAGTIPAVTKALTALSPSTPSTSVDFATGRASMVVLRNNMATVVKATNMVMSAIGATTTADSTGGSTNSSRQPNGMTPPFGGPPANLPAGPDAVLALVALPVTTSGSGTVAGETTINKSDLDAFFTVIANVCATIATKLNTALPANARPLEVVVVD